MSEHPNAHYIVDRVESAANEFDWISRTTHKYTATARLLAVTDRDACLSAAALIKELDRELFRVRTAAAMHLQGRMSRNDLRKIIQSWNDDEQTPKPPVAG